MYQVGLTGGIAAGKSTVVDRLHRVHGLRVVDADRLARDVIAPGTDGINAIEATFGSGVIAADGRLDRPAMGALIFANPQARTQLEAIIHPRIQAERDRIVATATEHVLIHDIPLLIETGLVSQFDEIVVVHCPAVIRVQRLINDRGMSADDAWARVYAQASDEQRLNVADTVIDNAGTLETLIPQIDTLGTRLAKI